MDHFDFTLTGITKTEYHQACHLNNRRSYGILVFAMVIICGVIILATGNASAAAFLGPLIIFVVFVVGMEVLTRFGYKDQLASIDPVVYHFSPVGWEVTANNQTVGVEWRATVKMKNSRDCIFLYNDDASSNLLPKRLMTAEQMDQIRSWYKDSRILSKDYQEKEMRKERAEWKKNHEHLRFGNTGPAWGPWKRKK